MDRTPEAEPTRTSGERPARRVPGRTVLVAALVAAVVAAGVSVPATWLASSGSDEPAVGDAGSGSVAAQTAGSDTGAPTATSIPEVADAVSPSVAYVEVAGARQQGSASAVIIDAEGHVLTNAHVVEGARELTVTLPNGATPEATLVGADTTSDLAVLEIDASGLPTLPVDSDVEVGEPVIAVGSPFGLEGSVTSGILSGTDRTLTGGPGQTPLTGMLQTDAAINPGNSGGALVDADGELIGINTAIYSATGTSSGVGFAIPADTAMDVAEQLIEDGTVSHARLGIRGGDVTPHVADAYGLETDEGALVVEVLSGSAAAEAGLQPGDAIVALDGEPVASMAELAARVRARDPGDEVTLTVNRDGERLELSAALGSTS